MKTFNEFLKEAAVSGDSGGSSADLSSGINSGNVVRKSPETMGKPQRRKIKNDQEELDDAGITYATSGLPKKGLPEPNK